MIMSHLKYKVCEMQVAELDELVQTMQEIHIMKSTTSNQAIN
jgi:hypothetical protein